MKKSLLSAVVTAFMALSPAVFAGEADCDLDCLICPDMADPKQYDDGIMKSLGMLAPGNDKWLFRSEVDLTNQFGIPPQMRPEFARLMASFAAKNIQVAIAVQPTRGLMHRDKVRPEYSFGFNYPGARNNLAQFLQQLRQGGALVPDMMPLVDTPPPDYFFRRDHHWTPHGAQLTARIVADLLTKQPFYAQLSKKNFRTEPGIMVPKDGTMSRGLKKICGNNYGFQYVRGFQTMPIDSDASALFDEAPASEVVLVGTSNSASRDDEAKNYNFDGYLKEYLSTDILNYALPGAGQDGSLIQYLHSPDYDPKAPPKLIIWELPASFHLETPLSYRQLIPAINGGCSHSPRVLASNKRQLPGLKTAERIELLSNAGSQRQNLQDVPAFLEIKMSDLNVKDFYIITYYDNGSRDKAWYRREGVVDGGLYYLELSRAKEHQGANLLSVFMEPVEPLETPTSVEVQLCL